MSERKFTYLLTLLTHQQKDTLGSRLVASGSYFRKKLYCLEEDLSWITFQNPPFIQWCSKLNTGYLLEDSNVEHSFEILSTAKKNNASVFRASGWRKKLSPGRPKKILVFVVSMRISKAFIIRQYSHPEVLFDEVPS